MATQSGQYNNHVAPVGPCIRYDPRALVASNIFDRNTTAKGRVGIQFAFAGPSDIPPLSDKRIINRIRNGLFSCRIQVCVANRDMPTQIITGHYITSDHSGTHMREGVAIGN